MSSENDVCAYCCHFAANEALYVYAGCYMAADRRLLDAITVYTELSLTDGSPY